MKKILVAFAVVVAVWGNVLADEVAKPLRVAVFVGSGARNVGAFRWLQITTCAKDMEPVFVDGASVRNGALDGADVFVVPGGWSGGEAETLEADGREKVKDFVRRGGGYIGTCAGCCLAMESHKTHKDMLHMIPYTFGPGGGAAEMPIAFNQLAKEMCGIPKKTWRIRYSHGPVPVPSTPVPEADVKVAHPLTAAIYNDKSGNNGIIARMLYFSPEYNLRILKAADYANGGLDGVDLLVQPGGSCKGQYEALGTNGVEALRRYILEGGRYYGVCAGAFMGAQISRPEWPRLGIVPFMGDDPEHYRGRAPIKVALTEEGQKVFEGSAKERKVIYAGGPALIPGDPVPDTDVQVLATYSGRVISTGGGKSGTEPVKTMRRSSASSSRTAGS